MEKVIIYLISFDFSSCFLCVLGAFVVEFQFFPSSNRPRVFFTESRWTMKTALRM